MNTINKGQTQKNYNEKLNFKSNLTENYNDNYDTKNHSKDEGLELKDLFNFDSNLNKNNENNNDSTSNDLFDLKKELDSNRNNKKIINDENINKINNYSNNSKNKYQFNSNITNKRKKFLLGNLFIIFLKFFHKK